MISSRMVIIIFVVSVSKLCMGVIFFSGVMSGLVVMKSSKFVDRVNRLLSVFLLSLYMNGLEIRMLSGVVVVVVRKV